MYLCMCNINHTVINNILFLVYKNLNKVLHKENIYQDILYYVLVYLYVSIII